MQPPNSRCSFIKLQENYVQSNFVRMAQMLNIGKKFEHFSSLEIPSSSIRRKKTLNSSGAVREPLKRHSHDCHERLKYYEVSYHCIHGGKDFKSRNTGMREQR